MGWVTEGAKDGWLISSGFVPVSCRKLPGIIELTWQLHPASPARKEVNLNPPKTTSFTEKNRVQWHPMIPTLEPVDRRLQGPKRCLIRWNEVALHRSPIPFLPCSMIVSCYTSYGLNGQFRQTLWSGPTQRPGPLPARFRLVC